MRRVSVMVALSLMLFLSACAGSVSPGEQGETQNSAESMENSESTDGAEYRETETQSGTENGTEGTKETEDTNRTDETIPAAGENEEMSSVRVTVGENTYTIKLFDNETSRAFLERLPMTLDMSELNGNEKYYYLESSLPTDSSRPSEIQAGDLMLYGSECLVLFYESFSTSYSYTPLGKMEDADGLAQALGRGSVQVTFEVE